MYNYNHETIVEADAESTFAWFEHEGSFRRLMPPWEDVKKKIFFLLIENTKDLGNGGGVGG